MTNAARVIAIGDIHGCAQALEALLGAIEPNADDVIVPLGDVIDRGPDAKGAVDQLIDLQTRCRLQPLIGNHEEMMLAVIDGKSPDKWIWCGGAATLDSYGFLGDMDVVPTEHVEFMRSFANHFETDTHFFVHANYDAGLPLTQQSRRLIRWKSLHDQLPGLHCSGKHAVVGHTADKSGSVFVRPQLTCIDTYCYGGGWLTAFDVVSGKIWQTNQKGQLRSQVLEGSAITKIAG